MRLGLPLGPSDRMRSPDPIPLDQHEMRASPGDHAEDSVHCRRSEDSLWAGGPACSCGRRSMAPPRSHEVHASATEPLRGSVEEQDVSAIAIEGLEARHLAQAHALSAAVGWPHRQEDWNFVLGLGLGLAALNGDELLGTIIWWPFGEKFTTLRMVIVAPTMQGARARLSQSLQSAHRAGASRLRLRFPPRSRR